MALLSKIGKLRFLPKKTKINDYFGKYPNRTVLKGAV